MKKDPLTFRKSYNEFGTYKFTGYRENDDWYVKGIDIVLEPMKWKHGVGVYFHIDKYRNRVTTFENEVRRMVSLLFYDEENMGERDRMYALAHGEVCGNTAEMMAHALYWNLFCFYGIIEHFIPEAHTYLMTQIKPEDRKFGVVRGASKEEIIKSFIKEPLNTLILPQQRTGNY